MKQFLNNKKLQMLLAGGLTFLAFSNIFQNEFLLDDPMFVLSWPKAHEGNLGALISGNLPEGQMGVYRPVRSILYALYYNLFGTYPFWYHLHSILLHAVVVVLVYLTVERITKKRFMAFVSSILFGLHPVHTEAITYISASMEMTGVVFMFVSFYLYLLWRENKNHLTFYLSLLTAFLAFFTYEMTLTLPLLIILYEFLFKRGFARRAKYWLYFLPALVYFVIRFGLLHMPPRGEYMGGSFGLTIMTMSKAFVEYIRLLIFPANLSINHTLPGGIQTIGVADLHKEVLTAQSVFDFEILLGISIFTGLVFTAFYLFKKQPVVGFAILWFLISLLPVSNIIPLQQVMSEKYLYIPSFGFVLLLGWLLEKTLRFNPWLYTLPFALLASFYFYLTFQRNFDWRSDLSIWSDTVRKTPTSASAHYNLGNIYYQQGNLILAQDSYQRALVADSTYPAAHNNIASVYLSVGNLEQAEFHYKKALEYGLGFWPTYFGLGQVYEAKGDIDLALQNYQKAIELNPEFSLTLQKVRELKEK